MDKYLDGLEEVLESLSKSTLIKFMLEYAKNHEQFANEIYVQFQEPDYPDEVKRIKVEIARALDGISDYRYRDSWGYVSFDVHHINLEIRTRIEQGHIQLAFMMVDLLYRELIKLFEYQGECEISDEAENCLLQMAEIAEIAELKEDKTFIFESCIALADVDDGSDYGADYESQLLAIAAKLVTSENRSSLEQALSAFNQTYSAEKFKLIELEMIQKLDGEQEKQRFIMENLQFSEIREIAFNDAVALTDFDQAERLCLEAVRIYKDNWRLLDKWLYRLESVYEKTKNLPKLTEVVRQIFFKGNMAYYEKLKDLLQRQSQWELSYKPLLKACEENLHERQYMHILSQEREGALLLKLVQKHVSTVFTYGKELSQTHREEVKQLFLQQLKESAELANNRKFYQALCQKINIFSEAGYPHEAVDLINEFNQRYARKPAFVDELRMLRNKLV